MIWIILSGLSIVNFLMLFNRKLNKFLKIGYTSDATRTYTTVITVFILLSSIIGYNISIVNKKPVNNVRIQQDLKVAKYCGNKKIIHDIYLKSLKNEILKQNKQFMLKHPIRFVTSFVFIEGLKNKKYQRTYKIIFICLFIIFGVLLLGVVKFTKEERDFLPVLLNIIITISSIIFIIWSATSRDYMLKQERKIIYNIIQHDYKTNKIDKCLFLNLKYSNLFKEDNR